MNRYSWTCLEGATLNTAFTKLLWPKIKVKQINCWKFLQFARAKHQWRFNIATLIVKYDI
jgi:hypothetical protein